MNTIKKLVPFLALALLSCKTPNILISEDLKCNSTELEAKGRQGWQFNQVITFGDYKTSKIHRGWISSQTCEFITRFEKASQKLSFTQYSPKGTQAEVFAVSKFENNEIGLLDGFLSFSLKYENTYAGTIINNGAESGEWNFIVYNPEGGLDEEANCGMVVNKTGNELAIKAIRRFENNTGWPNYDNLGFEFIKNGRPVAAVSVVNAGKVWIDNNLNEDEKLIVAALSSAMLVRQNIENSVNNN